MNTIQQIYNSQQFTFLVEISKKPIFFIFPEMFLNPTKLYWFPYLALFIRVRMLILAVQNIHDLYDLIPFFHHH